MFLLRACPCQCTFLASTSLLSSKPHWYMLWKIVYLMHDKTCVCLIKFLWICQGLDVACEDSYCCYGCRFPSVWLLGGSWDVLWTWIFSFLRRPPFSWPLWLWPSCCRFVLCESFPSLTLLSSFIWKENLFKLNVSILAWWMTWKPGMLNFPASTSFLIIA